MKPLAKCRRGKSKLIKKNHQKNNLQAKRSAIRIRQNPDFSFWTKAMSSHNRKSREQLKEEYKQHFRKMRAAKERYRQTRKTRNIVDALKEMDSTDLMESFDSFLFELQNRVTRAEARLDVALETMELNSEGTAKQPETRNEDMAEQTKAKETLQQVKAEMGLLYSELEQQARQINVNKTIGTQKKTQPLKDKA